tara:strand:+ start:1215 stop:1568 length:354 start_codon:yes stop_codon:yes gene_type:complete
MSERKKHTKKARAREKKASYHRRSREEFEEEDEEFEEEEEEEEEEEITQNQILIGTLLPIIQNAPKTPTPPHRASCAPWATVGTRFTFVAAQCVRGTNVFNTSLIVVVVVVVVYVNV